MDNPTPQQILMQAEISQLLETALLKITMAVDLLHNLTTEQIILLEKEFDVQINKMADELQKPYN